jgi:1-acyl-sn-glycerol-3-phosphate acyltransferase
MAMTVPSSAAAMHRRQARGTLAAHLRAMRAIDGFDPSLAEGMGRASSRFTDAYGRIVRTLANSLAVEVRGLEQIPAGRALLVANHAFGWDVAFPIEAIARATGRPVWALGEHLWWKIPILRRVAASMGVVDGRRDVATRLLSADQIVVVLPGGLREAVKPRELRYQLLWGKRYGFVEVAVRTGTPIVPLACTGADEFWDFVGDPYARGRRWLHVWGIPVPLPSRILPIPHLAPLRYVIGEPISVTGVDPEDRRAIHRLRREVGGALHELIEDELARRMGVPYP